MLSRTHFGILATVALLTPGFATAADSDVQAVLVKVASSERSRDAQVRGVRSIRRYVLRNPRWAHDGVMTVLMSQSASGEKKYNVLDIKAEGIQERVFSRVLEGEVEASRQKADNADLTPENYEFILAGRQRVSGRDCIVVQLKPRRKSKVLLEGKAWIDAREFALVRIEGRPSKSFGFWVGKPHVAQDFRKVGDFWLISQNHSIADVKLVGKTELTVDFLDYSVTPKGGIAVMACVASCSPRLMD